MNLQRKSLRISALALMTVLVAGCATTQPLPDMTQARSSALAIDVLVKPPMGGGGRDPVQVYFARVEGVDGLMQQTIVRSNYVKDSRAYLLNARPGTYVAVASIFVNPGLPTSFTTYFPRAVVERTRVTVGEGEVASMGACLLGSSVGLDGADDVQTHYKNVIAPGQATGVLAMSFSGAIHYRGNLIECKSNEQGRRDLLQKVKGDLSGSGWQKLIP